MLIAEFLSFIELLCGVRGIRGKMGFIAEFHRGIWRRKVVGFFHRPLFMGRGVCGNKMLVVQGFHVFHVCINRMCGELVSCKLFKFSLLFMFPRFPRVPREKLQQGCLCV